MLAGYTGCLSSHLFGKRLFVLIIIMSTSLPPFGDIVVVTPGGLQDGFEWDEMQMKVIYEHREYHSAMIHFLDDLAYNGPGGDMPRRPKGNLASLLNKPSNKLCGVELHTYLIKSLLCAQVVNQPGFASDGFYTDLDQICLHLVACYELIKKQNAVGLRVFCVLE